MWSLAMEHPDDVAQSMYVQVARRLMFDGIFLTLLDLAPATFFIADKPVTSLGLVPTSEFLDGWYADGVGVGTEAVPAVLSLLDADRAPSTDSHLLISLPRIRDAGLEYRVQTLTGDPPPTAGACVLFIRPLVRPTTPVNSRRSSAHNRPPTTAA